MQRLILQRLQCAAISFGPAKPIRLQSETAGSWKRKLLFIKATENVKLYITTKGKTCRCLLQKPGGKKKNTAANGGTRMLSLYFLRELTRCADHQPEDAGFPLRKKPLSPLWLFAITFGA